MSRTTTTQTQGSIDSLIERYSITLITWGSDKGRLKVKGPFDDGAEQAIRANKAAITDALIARQEAKDRAVEDAERAKAAELQAIREGRRPLEVTAAEGEWLGDYYTAYGPDSELLKELGIAEVSGYTTVVDKAAIKVLGTSFSYVDAEAYAASGSSDELTDEPDEEAKIAQAISTGERVIISTECVACKRSDCSLDYLTTYANPAGTISVEKRHTH